MILIPIMMLVLLAAVVGEYIIPERHSRALGAIASGIVLLLSLYLILAFNSMTAVQTTFSVSYISSFGIDLSFVLSNISVILVLLASIVSFAAVIGGNPGGERRRASNALIMLFELAAIGFFTSGNLFILFIFWDVGVVSAFFMINCLGSGGARSSAKNYLIYSIFASALLLFGIMMIYFYTPVHSFNLSTIEASGASIPIWVQETIFALLLIAFFVKMPVFPLHSWMSDAYSDASTQGSMVLSGILSKFGAYGVFILFLMLPISHTYAKYILIIAIVSALYAAFNAMVQSDLKRMAAYTSMIESSLILVGIAAYNSFGSEGAVYGMLAYGLAASLMFLSVGSIEFTFGSREIAAIKGAVKSASASVYSFLIALFGSTGVPITAGFIADLFIFIGSYQSYGFVGLIPIASLVMMGGYLYYAVDRSFLSTFKHSHPVRIEYWHWDMGYAVLVAAIIVFGILPSILIGLR